MKAILSTLLTLISLNLFAAEHCLDQPFEKLSHEDFLITAKNNNFGGSLSAKYKGKAMLELSNKNCGEKLEFTLAVKERRAESEKIVELSLQALKAVETQIYGFSYIYSELQSLDRAVIESHLISTNLQIKALMIENEELRKQSLKIETASGQWELMLLENKNIKYFIIFALV